MQILPAYLPTYLLNEKGKEKIVYLGERERVREREHSPLEIQKKREKALPFKKTKNKEHLP